MMRIGLKDIFKKIVSFMSVMALLNICLTYSVYTMHDKVLDLAVLFDENESVEFNFASIGRTGALLTMLIRSMGSGIPVIASGLLMRCLGVLVEKTDSDHEDVKLLREDWYNRLNSYFRLVNVFMSNNGNFVIIIPKEHDLQGFNVLNARKIDFNNIDQLVRLFKLVQEFKFTSKDNFKIDIDEFKGLFSDDKINKNIFLSGHGYYSSYIIPHEDDPSKNTDDDGIMAGLSYNKYQDLVQFFSKINCEFLCITTCYGGGWNLYRMHKELIKQADSTKEIILSGNQIKFPIAMVSVTDAPAEGSRLRIGSFFSDLHKFLNTRKKDKIEDWIISESLKKALSHLSSNEVSNTSLIWFPEMNQFFKAVDVGTEVKFITLESLIEIELKSKLHFVPVINKHAIFIYPLVVPIPIIVSSNLGRFPNITSMIPGRAHHFIAGIATKDFTLYDILSSLGFGSKYPVSLGLAPRALFFSKLICKQNNIQGNSHEQVLENVLIKMEYVQSEFNRFKPKFKFIAQNPDGEYFTLLEHTEGNYKVFNCLYKGSCEFATSKLSVEEARNEIIDILKKMTPDKNVLSETVGSVQNETIFWNNIKKSLGGL